MVVTAAGLDHRRSGRFARDEVAHARIFVQRTSSMLGAPAEQVLTAMRHYRSTLLILP
ncbi:hypothetical protein [Nocardia sp. NPDC058666]|uniref:hypothetical protein n=1 Tax=Nocardia sp. NPDC058666 TaxID=3346587 RepID=UPI00364FEBC6